MKIVEIEKEGKKYKGILLPSPNKDYYLLKLDSGYNIGIEKNNAKIKIIKELEKEIKEEKEENKGEIAILGCGGTICSKVEYETGAVYPSSSPKDIYNAFPKLKKIAKIESKTLFQLLSEDMTPKHWEIIANEVKNKINEGKEGIILMHGTDTMHYTASAIAFAIQNPSIPIIFVGAQRSSDRPSSDNEMNMMNAVFLAKKDIAEVGILMHATTNDDFAYFHKAVKARKMHTSRRDAFKSINTKPIAKLNYEENKIEYLTKYRRRNKKKPKYEIHFNENVGMLYIYPGIKEKLLENYLDYDGLILVGTGLGHVPTNALNKENANSIIKGIKELIESDVKVAITSQTIYGRINLNVYSTGRRLKEIGVIGHGLDMTPETAFVKLSWILGKEKKYKKVKELYEKNIVGEICERISI